MKASFNFLPFNQQRYIAWFSCGAASAVAAKMIVEKYGEQALVINCDTLNDEHGDNRRFFYDVQEWCGVEILQLRSKKYQSIDDVFEQTKYMAGVNGARCTTELKKVPRFDFQWIEDVHILGYTADKKELKRIKTFKQFNPELNTEFVLADVGLTKKDCFDIISAAGIKRSEMYELGFDNANCIGCVKSSSPYYWNMIRLYFPEVFARRAEQSRRFGVRLVKYKGERIFLDELPDNNFDKDESETVDCNSFCQTQIKQ